MLTFALSPFDSNAPFQASSLLFRLSSVSLTNAKSSSWSSSSGHSDLIFLEGASSTVINNKGLNTEAWCNPTWTRKSSLKAPSTLARLRVFLYIDYTVLTNHFSIPSFFKATIQHPLTLDQKLSQNLQTQSTNSSFLLNVSPLTVSR